MIAAGAVREIDHPDRAVSGDPREQREQRPVERNPGFLDQPIVAARPVYLVDQVDDRGMQPAQNFRIMCIMHDYCCLGGFSRIRAYYT